MTTPPIDLLPRFPAERLESAGRDFSYRVAGSGPTLVLLHGIGSGAGSWVQQLAALGGFFRIIAWDAPGYGETAPLPQQTPTAADYAEALAGFLNALDIERTHLLGHSLGALMAAAFAHRYPQRLQSLILADPAIGYGAAEAQVRETKLEQRLLQIKQLGPGRLARRRAAALLSAAAAPAAVELVRWSMSRLHPDGYAQAAHMLAQSHLLDAAGYGGPVLVLCGSEDAITPETDARRVAAAFVNSRYRSLPGAGHACYVEAPALFNRYLLEFIGSLP